MPRGRSSGRVHRVLDMLQSGMAQDAELLARWREGDMRAGEALFERYYELVERFFANKVGDQSDDLVQETFAACVVGRDRVDEARFRSYLFAVAYNVLSRHLRQRYRGGHEVDLDKISVCDAGMGPSTLMAKRREQRLLLEGLRNIPVTFQVLLELYYWEDLSSRQIGEVLGLQERTVRARLQKARELLERAMERVARSPAILEQTRSHLEEWARQCRDLMPGPSS